MVRILREEQRLRISRLLSDGLELIEPYLSQKPDPAMMQQLGRNREHWFKALERLWDAGETGPFLRARTRWTNLMVQMGLPSEVDAWSLQLIDAFKDDFDAISPDRQLAWLRVATDSVYLSSSAKMYGLAYWRAWMESPDEKNEELMSHVMMFLEAVYRDEGDWENRRALSRQSLGIYEQQDAAEGVMRSLQSLARCEEALGRIDEAKACEERVLRDTPFDRLEEGVRHRVCLELVASRLNRDEIDDAHALLDDVRTFPAFEPLEPMVRNFQGRIHLARKEFEEAMPLLCDVWLKVLREKLPVNVELLSKNLE
ncbi:MAG: tetratricopeptide repeat protein, partial [Verrucomicrobiota bacterium]